MDEWLCWIFDQVFYYGPTSHGRISQEHGLHLLHHRANIFRRHRQPFLSHCGRHPGHRERPFAQLFTGVQDVTFVEICSSQGRVQRRRRKTPQCKFPQIKPNWQNDRFLERDRDPHRSRHLHSKTTPWLRDRPQEKRIITVTNYSSQDPGEGAVSRHHHQLHFDIFHFKNLFSDVQGRERSTSTGQLHDPALQRVYKWRQHVSSAKLLSSCQSNLPLVLHFRIISCQKI